MRRELAACLAPHVDRKLVKQTVMTSVYGVTHVGARQQIQNRLKERGAVDDEPDEWEGLRKKQEALSAAHAERLLELSSSRREGGASAALLRRAMLSGTRQRHTVTEHVLAAKRRLV